MGDSLAVIVKTDSRHCTRASVHTAPMCPCRSLRFLVVMSYECMRGCVSYICPMNLKWGVIACACVLSATHAHPAWSSLVFLLLHFTWERRATS